MRKSCLILTHYFVRKSEVEKLAMIEFCVNHYRKNNPDIYIILTGHGLRPDVSDCDFVYWEEDIIESELGFGHPFLSSIGINHALEMNFTHALKATSYGICLHEDILGICDHALGNKKLLITQETQLETPCIGDLFMYGELQFLNSCYNLNNWYTGSKSGLFSLANSFMKVLNISQKKWAYNLLNITSFRDIYYFKWIDLRVHWHRDLKNKKEILLNNKLSLFNKYLWGYANGKNLQFDLSGNLINRDNLNWVIEDEWNQFVDSYST